MARVVVDGALAAEFFGGEGAFDVDAASVFALVAALDSRAPGFAASAEVRAVFAVDGVAVADWSTPLAPASEVLVIPRIGGG